MQASLHGNLVGRLARPVVPPVLYLACCALSPPPATSRQFIMGEAPAPTEAGQVKVSIERERKSSTLLGCFTCCMSQHEQEASDAFDRHANTTVSSAKHPGKHLRLGRRRMSINEFGARRGGGTRPRARRHDPAMTTLSTLALSSLSQRSFSIGTLSCGR